MVFKKTRLAPTPSGLLHLGNIYSFMLTAKLAKQENAALLLRIDDMDRGRARPDYILDVFESLDYMGLSWQQGPKDQNEFDSKYSQTFRLEIYTRLLEKLVKTGKVFACSCSRSELQENGSGVYPGTCKHRHIPLEANDVCWRLDTSEPKDLTLKLYKAKSENHKLPVVMNDFVIRKKDGFPSYQLCSVADDLDYGVDLIVRGQDLWESSLAQLYLADVAGETEFLKTTFVHHSLIAGADGKKLSKSAGDTSIKTLRKKGYDREAILALIQELRGEDFLSH